MNKPVLLKAALFSLLAMLIINACVPVAAYPTADDDLIAAYVAGTVQARETQQAFEGVVAQLTQHAANPTAVETEPLPFPTEAFFTATPVPPTVTAQVIKIITATQAPPTPTSIPIPCDRAEFVRDVTFLDGSVIAPGATFSKIWRLKNSGSCTWNSNYALVFVDGDALHSYNIVPLNRNIYPGETADLSVELTAPTKQGHYKSFWMIRNSTGQRFGIGKYADKAFWFDIYVKPFSKDYAYDFAADVCEATWRSSSGKLSCMGDTGDPDGSVSLLDNPLFENGRREDELTIWMRPQITRGGWISGIYPGYQVKDGDHFRTAIGCLYDSKGCELTFSLDYQEVGNNRIKNLGSWVEHYDGEINSIDIDLSALAGSRVNFILSVTTHGRSENADGFWFVPSIRSIKPPDPPTQAPTAPSPQGAPDATLGS